MASPTKKVRIIRKRKRAKQGSERKAKLRNEGTTKSPAKLFGDEN